MADLTDHAKSVVNAFNNQDWDKTRAFSGTRRITNSERSAQLTTSMRSSKLLKPGKSRRRT